MSDQAPDGRVGLICERIAARIEDMRAEIAVIRDRVDRFARAAQLRETAPDPLPEPAPAAFAPEDLPPADPAFADPGADALPPRFEATAQDALRAADGFQDLEYGRSGPFRWTGPGHDARLIALVSRAEPLRAVVTLAKVGDPANELTLQLLVDGVAYGLVREPGTDRFVAGPIRPRAGGGATKISLRAPYMTTPAIDGGFDQRTRGVAFQRLVIEPV